MLKVKTVATKLKDPSLGSLMDWTLTVKESVNFKILKKKIPN